MEYATKCRERRKFRKSVLDNRRNIRGFFATVNSNSNDEVLSLDYDASLTLLRKRKRISKGSNLMVDDLHAQDEFTIRSSQTTIQEGNNIEQSYLGMQEYECQSCGALLWYDERIKSSNENSLRFSLCCADGKVVLPLLPQTPDLLDYLLDYNDSTECIKFRENIRVYNSMFAFTSIGAKIDNEINRKSGPYVFRISGQNHHRMGSLLPIDGERPKFAQLYIYDTQNEIDNRMKSFNASDELQNIDRNIVGQLIEMFDHENEIVKSFRMARDRFKEDDFLPIRLRLIGSRTDRSQYNPPSCSEIAGLIIGDFGHADRQRDIVVDHKMKGLKRISDLHPSFMAMQYPILFPYGEDGFRIGMKYNSASHRTIGFRKCITMREFYAYRIQNRIFEGKILIRGGRLFQQYLVDAFSCIEEDRLDYIRRNQANLRTEVYSGIKDAVVAGDVDGNTIGKKIILPASFTADPRYMIQNYQDAIAICRHCGHPDLFITFTCNAQWREIQNALQFNSQE